MWWSTSESGCYVSKASNVASFLGARVQIERRAEQSLVWSSGCNIVCEEEALITASFVWLHPSCPSILLTVQKFTQIILINTNLLVLISLIESSGKQRHCSCYLLLKDSGTLEKLWLVPELFIWPSLSFLQLCQENSGWVKWRSLETEAPWMGSSSPGDHWSPREDLNIRRSKELQLRLHIQICDDDVASSLDNLSVRHQPCPPLHVDCAEVVPQWGRFPSQMDSLHRRCDNTAKMSSKRSSNSNHNEIQWNIVEVILWANWHRKENMCTWSRILLGPVVHCWTHRGRYEIDSHWTTDLNRDLHTRSWWTSRACSSFPAQSNFVSRGSTHPWLAYSQSHDPACIPDTADFSLEIPEVDKSNMQRRRVTARATGEADMNAVMA